MRVILKAILVAIVVVILAAALMAALCPLRTKRNLNIIIMAALT